MYDNTVRINLSIHLPYNSDGTHYGPPDKKAWIIVDDIIVNGNGSIDLQVHYDKEKCKICNQYFTYIDYGYCDSCMLETANKFKCHTKNCENLSTTIREDEFYCESCADKIDDINSYY